jgi:hypothetical protein
MYFLLAILFLPCICFADVFSGHDPIVRQDFLLVDPIAGTTAPEPSGRAQEFSNTVAPVAGAPAAPKEGLMGLLYDRGGGCGVTPLLKLPTQLPKIALIRLPSVTSNTTASGTACTIEAAILSAQMDNATAVIVYTQRAVPQTASGEADLGIGKLPLVTFWVDQSTAAMLNISISQANSTVGTSNGPNTWYKYSRIILYPAEKFSPGVWEFTLIIVVVLLTVSFATSVAMHCHLYRVRRRRQREGGDAVTGRGRKTLLDKSVVESFPVITYTEKDAEAAKLAESEVYNLKKADVDPSDVPLPPSVAPSVCSLRIEEEVLDREGESSSMAIARGQSIEDESMVLQDDEGNLTIMESKGDTEYTISRAQLVIPTCAVCLEDFEPGDLLRALPCGHRFHTDCIDPWLTERSSACPMCKADFHRPITAAKEEEQVAVVAPVDAEPSPTDAASVVRRRSSRRGWFRRMTSSQEQTNIFTRYGARRRQERQQQRQQRNDSNFVHVDTQAVEGQGQV